ncbi:T9SS type A sorting domain-containing protein [Belliella sp. DSM 107340]|uniref:T9SS type A sorting domain-containing protein n=1 Tax=Belliella calami TaxID=2923436 RepID=A0ABS9UIQ0_9BACT|nr:T9SS type A sorting domain-containing protein [Belliella calami]
MKVIGLKYGLIFFFLVLICSVHSNTSAQNARIYANAGANSGSSLLGSINNVQNAIDSDVGTNATLVVTGIGNSFVRPIFPSPVAAGTPARIKIGKPSGLLNLLTGVRVRAYLGGTTVSPWFTLNSLTGLLAGVETSEVIFTPVNAGGIPVVYDRIEIRLEGALSLRLSLDVYDVYYLSDELSVCDLVKDYLYGSTSNIVGGMNPVSNPQAAFDGNLGTYADLRANVGLFNKTHLTALFDDRSRSGDSVHVVLRNPGSLLDLSLLTQQFAINTYMDNLLVENMELLQTFISLSLLPGESDIYRLSFPTNEAFNRIEVSLGTGLLSGLGRLHVFDISRSEHSANIEIQNKDDFIFCVGEPLTFIQENTYPGDTYEWKIGNQLLGFNESVVLPEDLPPGEYQIDLLTFRRGCLNATEPTSIAFTLIDVPKKEDIDVIPTGEARRDGDRFIYYEGLNPITLIPNYENDDLPGEFSWYLDEAMTIPIYDGMVDFDGTTYSIDENNVLTVDNWVFRDPDPYEFYLAYTNQLGCLDVKPFNFEAEFIILPQEITHFKAQIRENNQVFITWKSEIKEGYFEVQRSQDDLNFQTISKIPVIIGENEYFVTDSIPSKNNYYRLVHKDLDHKVQFHSSLLRVDMPQMNSSFGKMKVYPNPFINEINILHISEFGDIVSVRIVSIEGNKVVFEQDIDQGAMTSKLTITDLGFLKRGLYILQVFGPTQMFAAKILK